MPVDANEYLQILPEAARQRGDASQGEIALATDAAVIGDIIREREARFGPDGARVGVVYQDEYILLVRDPVQFPSGAVGTYLRIFPISALTGAAGAVMLTLRDGNVLLRRVFRHATRAWELECPRGFREVNTDIADTVRAEVREEIGLTVTDIEPLGSICGDTGLIAGMTEAFFVQVGGGDLDPIPDSHEAFGDLEVLPLQRLAQLLADGAIRDGYTLAAITLAQARGLLHLPRSSLRSRA
jgi:ADP-ribose pyrophosphatase